MDCELLGMPATGQTLTLDHEQFAYAGKFVMSNTGKTVARDEGSIIGAIAFNEDRSTANTVRLRYVTVRRDRQGDGVGSRLLRFTAELLTAEYEQILIAANNPIAYRACYRAGFVFTGEETGLAELLLRYDPDGDRDQYADGLAIFRQRDLPDAHESVLKQTDPPAVIDSEEENTHR